jgi:hypothetical protein
MPVDIAGCVEAAELDLDVPGSAREGAGILKALGGLGGIVRNEEQRPPISCKLPLAVSAWTPVAAIGALVFYANRALRSADTFYGYAAAAVAALIAGYDAPARECGPVWFLLAAGPFFVGW